MFDNFDKAVQDIVNERPKYNSEIIQLLDEFFTKFPKMRFIQGLWALGVISAEGEDKFYEESEDTFKTIKKFFAEALGQPIPCNLQEACAMIKEKCKEAIRIYDNEEFYEDDCDRFLGESAMAEEILEILDNYETFKDTFAKKIEEADKKPLTQEQIEFIKKFVDETNKFYKEEKKHG